MYQFKHADHDIDQTCSVSKSLQTFCVCVLAPSVRYPKFM